MYVRPRPRFRPRNAGGVPFSPALLFTSGVAGAWYDPSDYSTLFQDSAGTTPVTAVEQPVGLMLDKSQGLAVSAELVPDYDFATPASWTPETADWVVSGGKATYTKPGAGVQYLQSNDNISIVSGTWYKLTVVISGIASGNAIFGLHNKTASVNYLGAYQTISANGTYSFYFLATSSTTGIRIYGNAGGTATSWSFESFSIKSIAGNHARQATPTSCPVLRARYNLLTYSEQFDNAAWSPDAATRAVTTGPDGTNTAVTLTGNGASAIHSIRQGYSISGPRKIWFVAKAGTNNFVQIFTDGTSNEFANYNLATGAIGSFGTDTSNVSMTAFGSGWYVCEATFPVSNATTHLRFCLISSASAVRAETNTLNTSVLLWHPDIRYASTSASAPTYQRIAAATDYATAGFLPYLYFVTDDSFGTNSIDFTATDKMSVCAGVTKLSDAATGVLVELSADWSTNNGSFVTGAPNSTGASGDYNAGSKGIAVTNVNQVAFSAVSLAPITNVYAATHDIAGDLSAIRLNGAASGTNGTGDKGAGNFGNYPLFIGRRNNTSFPFNGNLYQLIVCGKALSASELASTEAYVNSKTGAY